MRQDIMVLMNKQELLINEMLEKGMSISEVYAQPEIEAMDIRILAENQFLDMRQADLEIRRRQERAPTGTVDF